MEETQQTIRFTQQGIEYVLRIAGAAGRNAQKLTSLFQNITQRSGTIEGLQPGGKLELVPLHPAEFEKFAVAAKENGFSFEHAASKDGKSVDIVFRHEDIPAFDRTVEQTGTLAGERTTMEVKEMKACLEKRFADAKKSLAAKQAKSMIKAATKAKPQARGR